MILCLHLKIVWRQHSVILRWYCNITWIQRLGRICTRSDARGWFEKISSLPTVGNYPSLLQTSMFISPPLDKIWQNPDRFVYPQEIKYANLLLFSQWCIMMQNNLPVCLALSVAPHCLKGCIYRRKFRNQTSDNMDRWNSRGGKSQRGEEKKREDQRGERVRRKKMQVREKIGKSRFTVFVQWFVAPEGRKVTSLKRRDAEPSGQMRNEKLHAVVARSTFPSQNAQSTSASEQF